MADFFETPAYDAKHHFFEVELPVDAGDRETRWSDALARMLKGESELKVERGRVDVVAGDYAIEVDRFHKYHEAIGQAIHYRTETGKQGVIALMITRAPLDMDKAVYIEETLCVPSGLRMILLYPSGAPEAERQMAQDEDERSFQPLDPGLLVMDVNRASLEDLQILPGLGPARAQAIIESRPYQKLDDILEVKGIGSSTYQKIAPFLKVEP